MSFTREKKSGKIVRNVLTLKIIVPSHSGLNIRKGIEKLFYVLADENNYLVYNFLVISLVVFGSI